MEQNASDLILLVGWFLVTMSLPIVIGIIAVFIERS